MDTLEFFRRVLPSSGYYCAFNVDNRQHGFFSTVEELASISVRMDEMGRNTYYAISSFIEKKGRKQANVKATKVIALDVDVGKYDAAGELRNSYATLQDAGVAVAQFITKTGLPDPLMVFSGNGLHMYWVMTRDLTPEEWQPLASALKILAARHIIIDPAVTEDSARVLRAVGITNRNSGKKAQLLRDASDVDPLDFARALGASGVAPPPQAQPSRKTTLLDNLAVKTDHPLGVASVIMSKCQQVKDAVSKPESVPEPLWYALIGVAAHCENPEQTAIEWSKGHPEFSHVETLRKLEQWKKNATGPTLCTKFESENPDGCKSCRLKGRIASPVHTGQTYKEVDQSAAPDPIAQAVPLPKPFKRTAQGIKMVIDGVDTDVCSFDIYPTSYGKDEMLGYEVARFMWDRSHVGWQPLVLRQALLTDGHREFATALADQGIIFQHKKLTESFQYMLRSYLDSLKKTTRMTNLYSSMGWKEDFSQFVMGDSVIRLDESGSAQEEQITLSAPMQRQGSELWETKGSLKAQVDGLAVLERADMPWHMFAIGVMLSAPLYEFTGLKGLTVSLNGPTGGGKTLTQLWGQSLWGNPDKLHFTSKFTINALFNRMSLYRNMPMTVDEATMMNPKDIGDFLYSVTQGADKIRLNRNTEERDSKPYFIPVVLSTNTSIASMLISAGSETEAQMARLLEINIPSHPLFSRDSNAGKMIYNHIHNNYGHIGRAFVSKLLELGPQSLKDMINRHYDLFKKKYKASFGGQERYWEAAVVLADMAFHLAHSWGLVPFKYERCIEWMLIQLGAIRKAVADIKRDTFDLISEYVNDHASVLVTVMHTAGMKPQADHLRMPREDIRIRLDLYRKSLNDRFDKGTMLMDRVHFRRWLAEKRYDYRTVLQDLNAENVIASPKSGKAYLGKDTVAKTAQTYVIGVNLNHPRLVGIIDDTEASIMDLTLGQLHSVPSSSP
jgi:hypothetical protein